MGDKMLLIATALCILSLASASLVPFITPCKASDNTCAKASGNKAIKTFVGGLPALGVEPLDPVHFDKIDSSTPNLKFILNDITVEGLTDCEITKLERDATNSKINIRLVCSLKLDGQYELSGNLLILVLSGKGKIHASLNKAIFDLDCDIVTKTGADGKKHWHIKRFHHKYDLPNESIVEFDNLLDNNEATKEFIKKNGSPIIKEIGNNMIQEAITRIVKNVQHFFEAVPVEDMSID